MTEPADESEAADRRAPPLSFSREAPHAKDGLVSLSPLLRRLVAPNASPFTFTGTCTYVVGHGTVAVIDPGPDESLAGPDGAPTHLGRLVDALRGDTVAAILVTHTHRDHSPAARLLKHLTGAPILGCAPHRAARPARAGEGGRLDAAADGAHAPDRVMEAGDAFEAPGGAWRLEAVPTPGHTSNHLAFALPEENALLSGDHVMAWSTTIVAPPDGDMDLYMASLEALRARDERVYWPGHGGPVLEPQRFVRGLLQHRRMREAAILSRLAAGDERVPELVDALYAGLAPSLRGAAALSVLAHLEALEGRGAVLGDADETGDGLSARYRLA